MSESIQIDHVTTIQNGISAPKSQKRNRFIPYEKKLGTIKEKKAFLEMLSGVKGYIVLAAREFGCDRSTAYRRMREDAYFSEAAANIRKGFDEDNLVELETISVREAKDPRNKIERIFQLNALDPAKYRPKQVNINATSIHVTIGWAPPALREKSKTEVKADYAIKGKTP